MAGTERRHLIPTTVYFTGPQQNQYYYLPTSAFTKAGQSSGNTVQIRLHRMHDCDDADERPRGVLRRRICLAEEEEGLVTTGAIESRSELAGSANGLRLPEYGPLAES